VPASAYLLLVSPREPRGRRFVRLRAPTVLAWFQRVWRPARDGAPAWRDDLHGDVYGLDALFDAIAEHGLACPTTDDELGALLGEHVYFERELEAEPHFVHVETDDDEDDLEYFFFDDVFLAGEDAAERLPDPASLAGDDGDDEAEDDGDAYADLVGRLRND
jgi:hypothetical protein